MVMNILQHYRARHLTTTGRGDRIGVEALVRWARDYGYSQEEVCEEIIRRVIETGNEHRLGLQLDVIDEIYAEDWLFRKSRRVLLGSHTEEEWQQKKRQYGYRCFYCGKKCKRLTKDHIVPVANGGLNTIDNIVPACIKCNRRKGKKEVSIFKEGAMFKIL